jgi:PAS domain S-box-containing protein
VTSRAEHVAAELQSRLAFETMLADLSSRFVNVGPGELDREIDGAQRRVCECLEFDLSSLWQWANDDPHSFVLTHLHRPLGGPPVPETMDAATYFPWCLEQFLAGTVVAVDSMAELPPEAARDRATWEHFGIKTSLGMPLAVGGGTPFGVLSFNTVREEREWPEPIIQRLVLVADIFANALARRRWEAALRESEERLSLAADAAGAGLWALDLGSEVFWTTDEGREIFGYSPDETITMERFRASIHPDDRDLVRREIDRALSTGERLQVDYRIVRGDGRVRWISSRGRPRLASTGEPDRLTGVSIDISGRRRGEEALRASEARLGVGAELAGLAFYELDYAAGVMYVDDRTRDLCGLPPDREEGLQFQDFWLEHLHPDDRPRLLRGREHMHDGRLDRLSLEYRYLHPSRGEVWIHHLSSAVRRDASGRAVHIIGVLRDVSQRKRGEEELRALSRRLITAQEEDRALLARELHDDLTQRVAVLAIEAGRAEIAAADGADAQVMRSLREGLVGLGEDIHALAYQLHPSVLDELGLAEALQAECERRRSQIRIDLSLEGNPSSATVGKDAALCLFRVAQEALNNVTRHAGAGTADVTLRPKDGGLLLAVRDDGVGFDQARPGRARSLGLASMRERVQLVNGTLDIESAPGRGTTVVAWVPAGEEAR